ncbi:MAG: winged helix DNA-binding domain-containing protein, partial [Chloroflexota bacterium]|nr:winged helix DNA-binding domain-containing protein [Chloroflexota bacterium]
DNAAFRAYVLGEIAARGPLRSRELDDRAEVPWQTGGWNDGKNVGRMLELLWRAGEIAIARREGAQRVWDLFERVLPAGEPPADEIVAIELMERQLRAAGLVQSGWGTALDYRLPGREVGEDSLRGDGIAVPVAVEGLPGEWLAQRDLLEALDQGAWEPRTTLLGPFDPLIADRERTAALFGFSYRFELYIPAARREFGPYTLVLLDGEALIGRVVAEVDRRRGELRVRGVHLVPGVAPAAGRRAERAIGELAEWLGVRPIGLR